MQIHRMDECDWVAAADLAQAITYYQKETGEPVNPEEAWTLGDEELDRLVYNDPEGDLGPKGGRYSFRRALALMLVIDPETGPCMFASTEQ